MEGGLSSREEGTDLRISTEDGQTMSLDLGTSRENSGLDLDRINCLTSVAPRTELRVDLADFEGNYKYAQYSFFSVGNSGTNYRLNIAGYTGTAGDSLAYHNGMQFSTKDRDNDQYSGEELCYL